MGVPKLSADVVTTADALNLVEQYKAWCTDESDQSPPHPGHVSMADAAVKLAEALSKVTNVAGDDAERELCAKFLDEHVEGSEPGFESWMYASRGYRIQQLMDLRAGARAEIAAELEEAKAELAARTELYNMDLAGLRADREALVANLQKQAGSLQTEVDAVLTASGYELV